MSVYGFIQVSVNATTSDSAILAVNSPLFPGRLQVLVYHIDGSLVLVTDFIANSRARVSSGAISEVMPRFLPLKVSAVQHLAYRVTP